MNKQLSLIFAVLAFSTTYVYAHDTGVPHEEPQAVVSVTNEVQLVPISSSGRRPVIVGGAMGQADNHGAIRVVGSTTPPLPVTSMGVVSTGDPAVDAQIKALNKEMEVKIRALRDEYAAKIKVIIGDKKILPRVSTTTRMREDDGRNGRPMMNGSSTEGGDHMMGGEHGGRILGGEASATVSSDQPDGSSNFIKNFFKSLLGR